MPRRQLAAETPLKNGSGVSEDSSGGLTDSLGDGLAEATKTGSIANCDVVPRGDRK